MVQETDGRRDEAGSEGERPRAQVRRKLVPVRVVGRKGQAALVEWAVDGDYARAHVPPDQIENGKVDANVLEAGVPYGIPWENFLRIEVTAGMVAMQLRRMGIWTLDDLKQRAPEAKRAVQEAVAFDIGELIRAAEQEA